MYKPCALFFQLWGRGGAVLQQHPSGVGDGTPSVAQHLVRAVPVQPHTLWGGNVRPFEPLLPSASLPFHSSGFPSTRLVLVSALTLRFLPSSPSCSRCSGLYPESQFRAVSAPWQTSLHRRKHRCAAATITAPLPALLPGDTHTLLPRIAPRNGFTGGNICGDRGFFLKCKYQKMLTEGTYESNPGGASVPM